MHLHSFENDPEYIQLQTEMVRMQSWLIETNRRLIILYEGRDSAGKGGAIMRFIRYINPRHYRVVALNKPTEQEKGQWYFQRYVQHFPSPGEIVFFDRSWYNRAVVEPVMGFCSQKQYDLFMKQVVQFENMLIEDGIILFKMWFSIDKEEQFGRLEERKLNPLINWKLSTVDMQAQLKWDDFTRYKELMFAKTGTQTSPWIVVKGNNKDNARKEAMRYVLEHIDYNQKGLTGVGLKTNPDIVSLIGL
ncbi:polyphosphate kinase 2 [Plebeiibacterium marinum]|uniref:ADP/GDP-polyphosphate phosphotransferase n=1 Tax=Plebeiibacterium marinum TaxID=2992111 RepID=A0AAE3MGN1_9BACT|nr:polyphosphate kinase 2 [Plebeiobacterium marinum]MCW3807493.1 polyphosphate kinase 2 [Plebeiobacterium marinum]